MKNFIREEFNANLTEEQIKELCDYFGIYFYDKIEIKEELKDDLRINEYIIEFVDIKALAEDNNYKSVNDDLFVDLTSIEEFKKQLELNYGNNMAQAISDAQN